ncbi:TP53-target gene 5 protein [Molossus molossus]|uniref:TP53 target 5 n=1 Tax=Molossus molossus TaxID=27622 RepID=A0A7J8HK93_MOLMO|nr:TP53-target gene 5 protein [Molossus molossus]KAF6472764.1 TP53 target 5 [Molossus molossus]
MSPSAKKRPRNSVGSKMQDEEPHKIQQPVSKLFKWNRLKMVLKNLSLLRLLKNSNPRIQELHNLAKRCWNSPFKVQKVLLISRDTVRAQVDQNKAEPQEACYSKKKLESKTLGKPKESKPKEGLPERKARQSCTAVPEREKQVKPEGLMTLRGHGQTTCPGAWGRHLLTGDPGVVFPKTHHGHKEQLEGADQRNWFEGLPTRVHLPGPRVMCRSSTLRFVKRCCTRFCSASLELPMCHPYRV